MWTIKAKYCILFICLLFIPLSWAEDIKNITSKKANDTEWSRGKHRRLFARRRIPISQERRVPKLKAESVKMPVRRCGRLMENCSYYLPCCGPCASCRCRLFNTICHCWKMSVRCTRKT